VHAQGTSQHLLFLLEHLNTGPTADTSSAIDNVVNMINSDGWVSENLGEYGSNANGAARSGLGYASLFLGLLVAGAELLM
jgi:hypothetical protein